jgi:hypothetical protein
MYVRIIAYRESAVHAKPPQKLKSESPLTNNPITISRESQGKSRFAEELPCVIKKDGIMIQIGERRFTDYAGEEMK